MEEIGYKCQTLFISPLRGRRKHTTSVRFFSVKILCCQDDTRFHLNLTSLKPWANQYIFVMEMFFLSYVNEIMYLLWNLPFFEMVPLKTNFWLIIAQQTSIDINCFTAGGWRTSCHPISKMHFVGEGPGETPSALRCVSYLINNFLTDRKQLAKTSRRDTLRPASDVDVRNFLCPFLYFNKTLLYRSPWVIKPGPWSRS